MNDINWDLAPEGTTELREDAETRLSRWFNKEGKFWALGKWVTPCVGYRLIATRPQPERKTVEDAVEAIPHADLSTLWTHVRFNRAKNNFFLADGNPNSPFWNVSEFVCTREELEACVAAKSESHFKATRENLEKIAGDAKSGFVEVGGPEWTHLTNSGYECKIIQGTPDENGVIVVMDNIGVYRLHDYDSLKPLKPTITEKERETVARFVAKIFNKKDCDLRKEFDDFINEHEVNSDSMSADKFRELFYAREKLRKEQG